MQKELFFKQWIFVLISCKKRGVDLWCHAASILCWFQITFLWTLLKLNEVNLNQ